MWIKLTAAIAMGYFASWGFVSVWPESPGLAAMGGVLIGWLMFVLLCWLTAYIDDRGV